MPVENQFITMPVLKEMLAMQKESYQSSLKLIMDGVETEVKELLREVQEMERVCWLHEWKIRRCKDEI